MQKILVVGSTGQLGQELLSVFGTDAVGLSHEEADITDLASLQKAFHEHRPSVVINSAAFTKTDVCEAEPEKAFRVNSLGAWNVAKAAAEIAASVVYVSTDYVFGDDKKSFNEEDVPHPLNVYGASKLSGEILTRIANPHYYIVRTNTIFGIHPSKKGYNFVTLMLKLANEGKPITVVDDQFGSPTYTLDLAGKIKEIIEKPAPFGIYHITNEGSVSWYAFAKMIFEAAGLSPDLKPVKRTDRPEAIHRPTSSVLENKALVAVGLTPPRSLKEALRAYLDEIKELGQNTSQ